MQLLYWQLAAGESLPIPPEVSDRLARHFQAKAVLNLFLIRQLLALLRLLGEHGIDAIPFKGVVLATSAYGNCTLRKPGDLDVLIRPRDALKAKNLLISQGFSLVTPVQEDGFPSKAGKYEYRFTRDQDDLVIELRWRLTQRHVSSVLSFESLWERRKEIRLADADVPDLAPEDLLLILCLHGAKHYWARLMWITDLAELLRSSPSLNWDYIQEQASKLGAQRTLALGLLLAGALLDAPLPANIGRAIGSGASVRLYASQVCEWLFSGSSGPLEPTSTAQRRLYTLWLTDRMPDRLRFCCHRALCYLTPNRSDRAFARLPASLGFLYYVLRPVRLVGRGCAVLLKGLRLSRDPSKPLPVE
jgi:hypothetical protein